MHHYQYPMKRLLETGHTLSATRRPEGEKLILGDFHRLNSCHDAVKVVAIENFENQFLMHAYQLAQCEDNYFHGKTLALVRRRNRRLVWAISCDRYKVPMCVSRAVALSVSQGCYRTE